MLFGEEMRKVFLAGIGALASTVEAGQKVINSLVEKGEITIQQGKVLNEELTRDFNDTKDKMKKGAIKEGINTLHDIEKLSRDKLEKLQDKLKNVENESE